MQIPIKSKNVYTNKKIQVNLDLAELPALEILNY